MSHDTEQLNRRAAELMGWTGVRFREGDARCLGKPPFGLECALPMPAYDYGDALRLLEFASSTIGPEAAFRIDRQAHQWTGWAAVVVRHLGDRPNWRHGITLPLAITRACVAALEAVRKEEAAE